MSDQPTPTEVLAEAIQVTAKILTRRIILSGGMLLDFILWAWGAYDPQPLRLLCAAGFGVLVWVSVSYPRQ